MDHVKALRRCVGDERAFLADTWGRRPLVVRAADTGADHTDLLSLDDVDHLVTTAGMRTPGFRLVKDGTPLPPASYTTTPSIGGVAVTGLADPAKVLAAIDDGATLVLQGLHRTWPPLRRFVRDLELTLGHPGQVNAYFTPPGAQGLKVHSDPHDVFVLQAFGSKRWEIHAPDEVWDIVLEPGDSLYMPAGTPHAATAQDTLSGHLTIGVPVHTWRDVLGGMITQLLADDAFGERVPVGWQDGPTGASTAAGELSAMVAELRSRLDGLDPADVLGRRAERFLTGRPAVLAGGLVDRTRLDALGHDTVVRPRAGAFCTQRPTDDGRTRLLLGDRSLTMPDWVAPAVDQLVAGPCRVGDLALDPTSRLVLVRRLVREGLLEIEA